MRANEQQNSCPDMICNTTEINTLNICYDTLINILHEVDIVSACCYVSEVVKQSENTVNGYKYIGMSSSYDKIRNKIRSNVVPTFVS